ncbi:hypothetical protein HPB50_028289 [Hyalomma asiaticum]|nr:hypothetical protein HPB50_028289 [Hyalomma asiaticum]
MVMACVKLTLAIRRGVSKGLQGDELRSKAQKTPPLNNGQCYPSKSPETPVHQGPKLNRMPRRSDASQREVLEIMRAEKHEVKRERGCILGVLACVDSTLVAIEKPQSLSLGDTESYMTRKGYYALNVMGPPAAPTFQVPEVTFSQASGTTHTNERASVPLEKPPSAPECPPEAMEVAPGPSASATLMGSPKVRRSSLDRLKGKKHPPVKPPDKGGEVTAAIPAVSALMASSCRSISCCCRTPCSDAAAIRSTAALTPRIS